MQKVKIQLKWVPQAQFAGLYVAQEKGFYKDEGIDVEIVPGGPDVVIEQQVVNGAVDLGISSMDSLLVNRDNGLPLVSPSSDYAEEQLQTAGEEINRNRYTGQNERQKGRQLDGKSAVSNFSLSREERLGSKNRY